MARFSEVSPQFGFWAQRGLFRAARGHSDCLLSPNSGRLPSAKNERGRLFPYVGGSFALQDRSPGAPSRVSSARVLRGFVAEGDWKENNYSFRVCMLKFSRYYQIAAPPSLDGMASWALRVCGEGMVVLLSPSLTKPGPLLGATVKLSWSSISLGGHTGEGIGKRSVAAATLNTWAIKGLP